MNRATRRREAAEFKRWRSLMKQVQRWAGVSDKTMETLLKDGSIRSLVHDAYKAGRLTRTERSRLLA